MGPWQIGLMRRIYTPVIPVHSGTEGPNPFRPRHNISIAAGAGWLAPPPFNFAIGGGAMVVAGVLGYYGHPVVSVPVMQQKAAK